MANLAQMVNALAPIFTSPQGLFLQTIYHPLRLYAEHHREIALDVHVSGETYALSPAQETEGAGRVHRVSDLGPFTLLDASATVDAAGGQVTLAVVNRDRDRDIAAGIDLGGAALAGEVAVAEVNGHDVAAVNSFEAPRAVDVREHRRALEGSRFEHRFPAHSVSVLRFARLGRDAAVSSPDEIPGLFTRRCRRREPRRANGPTRGFSDHRPPGMAIALRDSGGAQS